MLDRDWMNFKWAALAPNTKAAYSVHVKYYIGFCKHFGYKTVPATPVTLCRFAAYLARTLSPSSVRCYMAGIRHMHLELGHDPPTTNYHVTSVLKGLEVSRGTPPKQKLPITLDILKAIYLNLDLSDNFYLCFYAACLVGFFTFVRKSTLLTKTLTSHCCRKDLCRKDFSFDGHSASITIKHSKTMQNFSREIVIPIPIIEGSILCPVTALLRCLVTTKHAAAAALFSYRVGESAIPLTHSAFNKTLSDVLQRAGYSPSQYSGHSLRRGGCTFALSCQLPTEVIKAQGDWASNAYERYANVTLELRKQCAHVLGEKARAS